MTALSEKSDWEQSGWQALRFFGGYRIFLALSMSLLIVSGYLPDQFGQILPTFFRITVFAYLGFAILSFLLTEQRSLSFRRDTLLQVMLDFSVLAILLFTSGGVSSGLGLLLVISVAAASLLLMGRTAYFFAAIASLIVLSVETLLQTYFYGVSNYMQAGLLGAIFFMTAFLAYTLAGRLRESEALAAQRGEDLENLSRLNARIVQRMRSGVMVVNQSGMIMLANASAVHFLGETAPMDKRMLFVVSPELNTHVQQWLKGDPPTRMIRPASRASDIQVSLTSLGPEQQSEVLIFLEDAAAIRQRAQQLKLASLGQLTASIAHEVRNPLGAISHAGQLLAESESLPSTDQRLIQIIRDHSSRVNKIIENVLGLGRRDDSVPESFPIAPWLNKFEQEFRQHHQLTKAAMTISVEPVDLFVTMDQSQLYQVLINLSENALRYSEHDPKIQLVVSIMENSGRPILDVIDTGPGIASELADKIFEPFFTDRTRTGGTGLGLYIASELCEANQALLALQANSETGCCFRITFPHPDKQIQID